MGKSRNDDHVIFDGGGTQAEVSRLRAAINNSTFTGNVRTPRGHISADTGGWSLTSLDPLLDRFRADERRRNEGATAHL